MRRWDKRRFFITHWKPGPPIDHLGPLKIDANFSMPACTIFGYEQDSEIDADHYHVDSGMKRGLIFGRWFSAQCVEGEWGHHHIKDLSQIAEATFDAAQQQGFRND